MATTSTFEPSPLADAPLLLPSPADAPFNAPVLPAVPAEISLPGPLTLSPGPASPDSAAELLVPAFASPVYPQTFVPDDALTRHRRRARLADRLFHWSVCGLLFLSGGVALFRLLWMGQ